MYQDGIKVKGYQKKKLHKKKLKDRYATQWSGRENDYNHLVNYDWERHIDGYSEYYQTIHRERNNGEPWYWQFTYLTGPRQYAKSETSRAIRAENRQLAKKALKEYFEFLDDLEYETLSAADYQKFIDYSWILW